MGVDSTIDSLEAFIGAGLGVGVSGGVGLGNGSGRHWKLQGINNNISGSLSNNN